MHEPTGAVFGIARTAWKYVKDAAELADDALRELLVELEHELRRRVPVDLPVSDRVH